MDASAHGRERIERWLAVRHNDLHEAMSRFLDLDAGQWETMLHAEHADLLGVLESKLDIEADLAAILAPRATAALRSLPSPPQRGSSPPDMSRAIAAADPAMRMALRHSPIILAVILSDLVFRAVVIANSIADSPGPAHVLARARNLAFDLGRAIDRAYDLDRYLVHVRDRDRYLSHAFARARNLAHALAHALARELAQALVEALSLASNFALDHELARNLLDHSHELARNLVLDFNRIFTDYRSFNHNLNRTREVADVVNRAYDLIRHLADTRDRELACHVELTQNLDLAHELVRRAAFAVGRALGIRNVEGLAAALLDGVLDDMLDDFTRADLTHIGLNDLDLTGVCWSVSDTGWPPEADVNALRRRSREIAPGSGIFVITDPADGNKARHRTPA